MRATTNTPDLLIIERRPWVMGIGLAALTFIFVAIGISLIFSGESGGLLVLICGGGAAAVGFFAFVRRAQVVFHRPEGWVELRSRSMLSSHRVRYDLSEVSRAVAESYGDTTRVALVIPTGQSKGQHPITQVYTSGTRNHDIVKVINMWLEASR